MRIRVVLLLLCTIIIASLSIWAWEATVVTWREEKALRALGLERATQVGRVEELAAILDVKDRKTKEALNLIGDLRARLAVVAKESVIIRDTIEEATDSFRVACSDWTDEHGRFHFNQAERRLNIDQRFRINTLITELHSGKVFVNTRVHELSPKDGTVLREIATSDKEFAYLIPPDAPPHFSVFLGAAASNDGSEPLLSFSYRPFAGSRFFNGLVTGAFTTGNHSAVFGGWSWSWSKKSARTSR